MTGSRSAFVSLFGVFETIPFKLFSIIGFLGTIMGKNGGFVEMRGGKFNENFSSKKTYYSFIPIVSTLSDCGLYYLSLKLIFPSISMLK